MEGVSSSTPRYNEPLFIDHRGGSDYTINGKAAKEAEVNAALAPRGLVASRGAYRTNDGFELGAGNASAVTLDGGAPLPEVSGALANGSIMGDKVAWVQQMS